MRRLALAALLSLTITVLVAASATAQPKPGTVTMQLDSVSASVSVRIGGAESRFGAVAGALEYDPANPDASTLLLSFDAGSIADAAMRKALDADAYPELRLASTAIARRGALPAALTMRDMTRPVIFQVRLQNLSRDVIRLHAEGTATGAAFGIKGGDVVFVIDAPFNIVVSSRTPQ